MNVFGEPGTEDPDDPTGLPLFAAIPSPKSGRVRSGYTMRAQPAVEREGSRFSEAGIVADIPDVKLRSISHLYSSQPGRDRPDWSQVALLRSQASERLSAILGDGRTRLDREAQQELGRSIILELLQAEK